LGKNLSEELGKRRGERSDSSGEEFPERGGRREYMKKNLHSKNQQKGEMPLYRVVVRGTPFLE